MAHLYPLVRQLVRAHLPRRAAEEDLVETVFMKCSAKLEHDYAGAVPLEHVRLVCAVKHIATSSTRSELHTIVSNSMSWSPVLTG